jgi:hypothetical protein
MVDADRTSSWRLVRPCFARIAIAIAGTSSNHDEGARSA